MLSEAAPEIRDSLAERGRFEPRCHETFDLARRCPKLALFLPRPTTIMSAENIVAFRSLTIFGS